MRYFLIIFFSLTVTYASIAPIGGPPSFDPPSIPGTPSAPADPEAPSVSGEVDPIVEIITFDAPYTGTGLYYEDGMEIERISDWMPLFYPVNSGVLDFSEYHGPITFDGSTVVFNMEERTFNLLSIDVVGEMVLSTNFTIFGDGDNLRFQAFGPPDGVIRPTTGTHSLMGYDFLTDISEFSIIGSGLSCVLDNIVLRTYQIPEEVPEPSKAILVSLCFMILGYTACFFKKERVNL